MQLVLDILFELGFWLVVSGIVVGIGHILFRFSTYYRTVVCKGGKDENEWNYYIRRKGVEKL